MASGSKGTRCNGQSTRQSMGNRARLPLQRVPTSYVRASPLPSPRRRRAETADDAAGLGHGSGFPATTGGSGDDLPETCPQTSPSPARISLPRFRCQWLPDACRINSLIVCTSSSAGESLHADQLRVVQPLETRPPKSSTYAVPPVMPAPKFRPVRPRTTTVPLVMYFAAVGPPSPLHHRRRAGVCGPRSVPPPVPGRKN